jgi:hypothetical protein
MLLATPHVLVDTIHVFHQRLSLDSIDLNHATTRPPIGAGNHFNGISRANQHRSTTTLSLSLFRMDPA